MLKKKHDQEEPKIKTSHLPLSGIIIINDGLVWFMVFEATYNNISVISWRSVLLVEETGENHRPVTSHHYQRNKTSC
jgi:hypothetical protein